MLREKQRIKWSRPPPRVTAFDPIHGTVLHDGYELVIIWDNGRWEDADGWLRAADANNWTWKEVRTK